MIFFDAATARKVFPNASSPAPQSGPPRKMIFAASIEDSRKHRATAVSTGTRLIVTHCEPFGGPPGQWMPALLEEIRDKAAQGFAVLLEDHTGELSPHAVAFNFEELDETGKTFLQRCLELYFSLDATGLLVFEKGLERFAIRQSEGGMVDRRHDEKGRTVYVVDWTQFNGGHRAILMCIAGAFLEEPLSDRWFNAMLGASAIEVPATHSWRDTWDAITSGTDEQANMAQESACARLAEVSRERLS